MSTDLHINALLTETAVPMGDHAQDVTVALVIDPGMTVRELCEKHLMKTVYGWGSEPSNSVEPNTAKALTIRLAVKA